MDDFLADLVAEFKEGVSRDFSVCRDDFIAILGTEISELEDLNIYGSGILEGKEYRAKSLPALTRAGLNRESLFNSIEEVRNVKIADGMNHNIIARAIDIVFADLKEDAMRSFLNGKYPEGWDDVPEVDTGAKLSLSGASLITTPKMIGSRIKVVNGNLFVIGDLERCRIVVSNPSDNPEIGNVLIAGEVSNCQIVLNNGSLSCGCVRGRDTDITAQHVILQSLGEEVQSGITVPEKGAFKVREILSASAQIDLG